METEKCNVCGHELRVADTFCPECGFERHIYPVPLSEEVRRYEEERIVMYKKFYDQYKKKEEALKEIEVEAQAGRQRITELEKEIKVIKSTPKHDPVAGYLVVNDSANKIVEVLNVFFGVNFFGMKPPVYENAHSLRISTKCRGLNDEHFSIDVSDNEIIAKRLNGDWIIGSSNHDQSITLLNWSSFRIDNLTFTFIEN